MQPLIVSHLIARYLDAYLEMLSEAYPYQPLSTVLNNFLRMSENGQTAKIEEYSRKLYVKIKELEASEDPPYVIEHQDGTVEKYKEEEITGNTPPIVPKSAATEANKPFKTFEDNRRALMEQFGKAATGDQAEIDKLGQMVENKT